MDVLPGPGEEGGEVVEALGVTEPGKSAAVLDAPDISVVAADGVENRRDLNTKLRSRRRAWASASTPSKPQAGGLARGTGPVA